MGQIFSIKDQGLTFLARVLNIEHSSNYDGHWDTTMKGTQFFDSDQIFNRVIAEPLGCINKRLEFKKSRTLPTKFATVVRAEKEEFKFLSQVMGDIEVGYLRNGSRLVEEIPVALHSEAMDHHMGVFATTGMGKSNFMKVFAASCMRLFARGESKFGLLIVDPHGEYLKGKGLVKGSDPSQEIPGGARLLFHKQAERLRSGRGGAGHIGKRDSSGGHCSAL